LLFLLAASFGPRHGVIVRWLRHQWLSLRILCDDVVALLYRREERELRTPTQEEVADDLLAGRWSMVAALRILRGRGELVTGNALRLTDAGRDRGRQLVRSHRLWEQYLVSEADAESDRIHDKAERFEHFTDRALRDRLDRATETPDQDPHGSPIPQEDSR